ncbi:sugar ABC transporter substrate-binding protein [Paenibacillus macerans]|uniref:ABC transporter substrate-binding protein n=1 Tax=Paenibacillus macerans TaxID=44252 RepID=UPI0020401A8E|nr:sugar ABC transporter substrate-binding protein [Paenibacillus macerans]MCM3699953.1 sugar ABC transporter substrate-binding protein [Paenibacillus macerans]
MKLKRKSLPVLLVLLLMMAGLLSACSGGSGGDTGANAGAESSASPDSGSKEPVTLRLTFWGSPGEVEAYQKAVDRLRVTHPHINVKLENIPSDYDAKLTTMVAGNEEPDVAMMESASIAFPLAEENKFLNLQPLLDADGQFGPDRLVPNISYYSELGNMIGIGPGPETFSLYYNVDLFKEAGVEPPPSKASEAWSWEEFVDAAKRLTLDENGNNATESDFNPKKIKQFGVSGANGWWGAWSNFVFSNGGDFVSEDGKTFGLNRPEAVEALQKVADLINVHHVAPSPVQAKNVPSTNVALQTKKVAMVIDGQWANFDLSKTGVNYDVAPLPVFKQPVTTVVCAMFSIFESTEHPEEAWELVKALLDPEGSLELNHQGLWMPALKDWYVQPDLIGKWTADSKGRTPGYKDAVIDMMLNYSHQSPTGYVKNFNKIMDAVTPALDKLWLGELTAQEAMDSVAVKAQAQVQGRRDIE